jgi:hypothetical protein
MRKSGVLIVLFLTWSACSDDSAPAPAQRWSQNIRVSRPSDSGFEPAIAGDGNGHVFIGYMNIEPASMTSSVVIAVSADDGASFVYPIEHQVADGAAGDVTVAADQKGNVYAVWGNYHLPAAAPKWSDLVFTHSSDSGQTWSPPAPISNGMQAGVTYWNDRPWIRLDDAGALNVVFAHRDATQAMTETRPAFLRSTDTGVSFSAMSSLTIPPQPSGTFFHSYFGFAPVGNELLIPYAEQNPQLQSTSSVGILRVSPAGAGVQAQSLEEFSGSAPDKAFPTVAGTPQALTFAASAPLGTRDVLGIVHSADDAQSFGAPLPPDRGTGDEEFSAAASDASGRCVIVWLDNRSGSEELWSVVVEPSGQLGTTRRINDAPMNLANAGQEGDYLDVTVVGEKALVTWADRRTLPQAVYFSSFDLTMP